MTKLLKMGYNGVISQLFSLDVQTSKPCIPLDLEKYIDNHSKVFVDMPKGHSPNQEHGNAIKLIPRMSICLNKC